MKRILILILIVALLLLVPGCDEANPGYVKIVDDDGNIATVDSTTRAISTLAFEHHQIHQAALRRRGPYDYRAGPPVE